MAIRLNDNKEIVEHIKQGLKEKGATAPADCKSCPNINVYAMSSKHRWQTLILRAIATVCCTIKQRTEEE